MKKIITKTNKYLLENYPNIWNTKIVWVLLISLILHFIFFCFGFLTFINPETLHETRVVDIYFENGTVFMNIILFILITVIWLSYLFKNNTFKSLYSLKNKQLFSQLLMSIIIILSTSSFYISYNYGIKTYININYDDERIEDEIKKSNKVAVFFSHNLGHYTLDERYYPSPFDTLYCSQSKPYSRTNYDYEDFETLKPILKPIDSSLPHLKFLDKRYYYYSLYKKIGSLNQGLQDENYKGFVYYKTEDTLRTYYYKDTIFDITKIEKSAHPSYYNYSSIFFQLSDSNNFINYSYVIEPHYYGRENEFLEEKINLNKQSHGFLKRNDDNEILVALTDFLEICSNYKVKHNLTPKVWFDLVYHPDDFKINALIRKEPKEDFEFFDEENKTPIEVFKQKLLTDYYIETNKLHNLFENVEDIKHSTPFLDSINVFLWLSFLIAAVILMFRTTGLKTFILTIVSAGVLSIFIGLSATIYEFTYKYHGNNLEYFTMYLSLILLLIIILIPISFAYKLKKIIVGICLNLSYIGFIIFIVLVMGLISMYQEKICYNTRIGPCNTIWDLFNIGWSPILFIINLIILYFYTKVIKKWKALPEA